MNVYELEKQATPGPWPMDITVSVGEATGGTTCSESNCNERLSRHCRNNFLRALEAYKRLVQAARDNGCLCLFDEAHDKLITELTLVK